MGPPREGRGGRAEACPALRETLGRERARHTLDGEPPDSVLAELRRSGREGALPPQPKMRKEHLNLHQGIKWGHLFGSRKAQAEEARPTNR